MSKTDTKSDLTVIDSFPFPVSASVGLEQQATLAAERCLRAYEFMSNLFSCKPSFHLQILTARDWASYTDEPTYGMPHYRSLGQRLILGGESSDFWRGFAEIIQNSSADNKLELSAVYEQDGGQVDLSLFFNLLAVHELAHGFHIQGQCDFPRYWLMEFFCNFCLHAYIASIEPEQLPFLETFPQLMTKVDSSRFKYHSLDDFELLYIQVGPENYGWYQTQLHVSAKHVFDTAGIDALKALWQSFLMPDSLLLDKLQKQVHPVLANIMTTWPDK